MSKHRKRSGKVKGWSVHVLAEFKKEDITETFIELAEFRINIPSQKNVASSVELNEIITNWAKETRSDGGYQSTFKFGIEKWLPIR